MLLFFTAALAWAQTEGDQAANAAYAALRVKDYDSAVAKFVQALAVAPQRTDFRKDLAYTLLKTGETEAARDQFGEAMRLDPKDEHVALEYAYLCYETRQPEIAHPVFDRLRRAGNPDAAQVFENVDRPLREGIARWQEALAADPDNFSAHEELARLAIEREDSVLAAEHYERAWRLRTDRRDLLLELGRAWNALGRGEDASAAWIAAWRGGTARVSEQARELLPPRYPYLSEFQKALALDPTNSQLQQDVAYQTGEPAKPAPGGSEGFETREASAAPPNAKALGIASLDKGYMADALKYLQLAHEGDPLDYEVMLRLGWAFNIVKDDVSALHWFDLARRSPDAAVSTEASRAYRNLAPSFEPFRFTFWAYPIYSSRWQDLFGYAQAKVELRIPKIPFLRPYISARLLGDFRGTVGAGFGAEYFSERSTVFAGGVATQAWYGLTGWFEAGDALIYHQSPIERRRFTPDYRGGISYAKGFGNLLAKGRHGWFAETNLDGVFVSRFADDSILYWQSRSGYTLRSAETGGFHAQLLWNAGLTADSQRQYWANYVETGPGVRFRFENSPLLYSLNLLRGAYLINRFNPRPPNYNEFRVAVWYAFTR